MIHLSTIPSPLPNFSFRCVDWSARGVIAVAARNSVLLYKTDLSNKSINFFKVIEFSSCKIYSLKFHHCKPLLAVSRDSGILIYDCENSQTISGTSEALKNDTQIEWCGDNIICFTGPNILFCVSLIKSKNDEMKSNSSAQVNSFNEIEFYENHEHKKLINLKIIWKIEMKSEFKGISIDMFNSCRILCFSSNSIYIYQSENPNIMPHLISSSSFNNSIIDALFHPQISDLIYVLTTNSSILSFELLTKSIFVLIKEENTLTRFEQIILSNHSYNSLFVICSDSTIINYETDDVIQYYKKCFFKVNKKNFIPEKIVFVCHPLLDNYYLISTKSIGLAVTKFRKNLPFFICVNKGTPHSITSFDYIEFRDKWNSNYCSQTNHQSFDGIDDNLNSPTNISKNSILKKCLKSSEENSEENNCISRSSNKCSIVGIGTEDGDIFLIDVFDSKYLKHLEFTEILRNSYKKNDSSSSSSSTNESKIITCIKFINKDLFLFTINNGKEAGKYDISDGSFAKFRNVTNIYTNKSFGVLQHGNSFLEIVLNHSKLKNMNTIRKIFLQTEISILSLQDENEIENESNSLYVNSQSSSSSSSLYQTPMKERNRSVSELNRGKFSFISPKNCTSVNNSKISKEKTDENEESFYLCNSEENDDYSEYADFENDENDEERKSGSKIAMVTLQTQSIVIYDILEDKYVRKLQCPKEIEKISSLSYTRNLIVLSDNQGKICVVNLDIASSRIINSCPFDNIKSVEFQKNNPTKIIVLSSDNKLAVINNEKSNKNKQKETEKLANVVVCNHFVSNVVTCGNSTLLVQSVGNDLKFISDDHLMPLKHLTLSQQQNQQQNNGEELSFSSESQTKKNRQSESLSLIKLNDGKTALEKSRNYAKLGYSFESLIWRIISNYFEGTAMPLKYWQFGQKVEFIHLLNFRSSLIDPNSRNSDESSMYSLLTAIRSKNIEKMRNSILSSISTSSNSNASNSITTFSTTSNGTSTSNGAQNSTFSASINLYCFLAAALIDSKIPESSIGFIEQTAMDFFEHGKCLEATILMEMISNDVSAISILQSKDKWNAAIEIIKKLEKSEETDKLIQNTAFHYLEAGDVKRALFYLLSIGDFHASLSTLKNKTFKENKLLVCYEIMNFVENKQKISENKLKNSFEPLSKLKEEIHSIYSDLVNKYSI